MSRRTRASHASFGKFSALLLFSCLLNVTPGAAQAQTNEIEGLTEPYKTIDVAAPEPGIIMKITVREGEAVRKGQVLAQLDDEVHIATLAVAQKSMECRGSLNSAIAEQHLRKDRLTILESLRANEHARQEEVDRARAELNIAEAKVLAVQEDLAVKKLEYEKIKAQLERRIIRSPADGVVTKSVKDEGEYVAPNDPNFFTVVQLHQLLATFSIPSLLARDLKVEQKVRLGFSDQSSLAEGIVEFVSPVTDAESGTVRVKVRIDIA